MLRAVLLDWRSRWLWASNDGDRKISVLGEASTAVVAAAKANEAASMAARMADGDRRGTISAMWLHFKILVEWFLVAVTKVALW